jgi:simple sugar transport system ATP-binding protein
MLVMRGISKSYGVVRANRGIDLVVPERRIVGLLGENGSGKTTLVNILFGVVRPDAGSITFKGRPLAGHTPREALAAGIGMIHQHFTVIPAMTVTENVMLGWSEAGAWLRARDIAARIRAASDAYGLDIDPTARVGDLPLGLRQRVEILKAVVRGAELLVLDEPSSNLSPPEVAALLDILRRLRAEGRSVVFISHKLGEVLEVCDEIVVLRDGEVAGAGLTAGMTRGDLARMMVGRELPPPSPRAPRAPGHEVLVVADLAGDDAAGTARLRGVSFSVRAGEIFAIAGVDGNGQAELAEIVGGLAQPTQGRVYLDGADITTGGVAARLDGGLAHIPADRGSTGLVKDMTVADNVVLRDFGHAPFRRGPWLDADAIRTIAERRTADFAVRATSVDVTARTLSGGNQQKVVLARELGRAPRALLAVQPTRGLDPGATRFVVERIEALRDAGAAVLYISTELEEVLAVGDRVGVMYGGRLAGVMPRAEVDLTRVGLMMAGALVETPQLAALYGVTSP